LYSILQVNGTVLVFVVVMADEQVVKQLVDRLSADDAAAQQTTAEEIQ